MGQKKIQPINHLNEREPEIVCLADTKLGESDLIQTDGDYKLWGKTKRTGWIEEL